MTTVLAISALRRSTRRILSRGGGLKSLQITDDTKDTCGSCSGFYSCWLWTRQNLATLECTCFYNHFGRETNKNQSGPNHKKHDQFCGTVKFTSTSFLCLGMNFSLNFPLLKCQGIVKKIVAEPRPGSTTLRPFWTPIVINGEKWVAPMNGRKISWVAGVNKTGISTLQVFMCLVFWWAFSQIRPFSHHNIPQNLLKNWVVLFCQVVTKLECY